MKSTACMNRSRKLRWKTRDELQKRIADISAFLREQPNDLVEYDESLVQRLIEKITIYEDKFTVKFKSGFTLEMEA